MRTIVLPLLSTALLAGVPPGPVPFRGHVIEAKTPGGYTVMAAELNRDTRRLRVGAGPKYEDSMSPLCYREGGWKQVAIDEEIYGILHRGRPMNCKRRSLLQI